MKYSKRFTDMRVAIWARSDTRPTMKLVWEGDLDIIPHIGWYIRLDGMIGSVPVSSVTLYPDSYGIGIGVNVSVVVEDLYGEFCDEGAGEDE